MKSFGRALLAALVVGLTCQAWGALPTGPVARIPQPIRQLMQDREYAQAVKAIDGALGQEKAPRDQLTYLKGRALYLQREYSQAAEVFAGLERDSADSSLVPRAQFSRALALMRAGNFRDAETIYRDRVRNLLSAERKHVIAGIYLEFADRHFSPAKESEEPDYAEALELYRKALEVGPKPQKRIEVELAVAHCLRELEKLDEAAPLYEKLAKDHPKSSLAIEARYRLGQCQLAMGQPAVARRTWQDLLADSAKGTSERFVQAGFDLAKTYGLPKPDSEENLSLGVATLRRFLDRHPEHKLASQAHLWIAQSYVQRRRYEDAVTSLHSFLAEKRYADRPEVPEARNLLGTALQRQKKFTEALAAWRDYLSKHPAHQAWSQVQSSIVDTEFLMGQEERSAKHYDRAQQLWTQFLAKYPLDKRAPAILFELGLMRHEQKNWSEAIAAWRRLVAKYPKTDESSRAQYWIALTLEEKLDKLEEALAEYKKVTWGNCVGVAKKRLARLTAKSLVIATERVFRANETPKIKCTTRNLQSVTVRAYLVDLETYFRKMHQARGVESLDITLIDPDKTFEMKMDGYADYREIVQEIPVPLPTAAKEPKRAGVMVVTVSSKTLEASTMVIQSNLDIIVKSSRDEVFVFAENMTTGRPWPNARLLISNGRQVFKEAATGPDGVFHAALKELKETKDVRVFAIAEEHTASNVVALRGVGVARGLSTKGYIYTDRPAYRAGQLVHVRGIVREVSEDVYTVPSGKKYTLEVFDARGRAIHTQEVTLGDFGSFHAHLMLPESCPQGDYRVQIREPAGQSFQGGFRVHEYQLEPVRLTVETERKVYYRGEEIVATINVQLYYGAPLPNREIRYMLGQEPVQTATTDAKGQVQIKLPTRDFQETQTLNLTVSLPERNLATQVPFFLATRGYSIAVSTVRPVFLASETFETTVTTKDAEGKPVARDLVVKVFQRTKVDGKTGELLVEEHKLKTNQEEGVGRVTLKLPKGARYVLRAEGTDRFGNPVSSSHRVTISDDSDATRLRVLADRHTYKVGELCVVDLHWREAPALGLVTYQGARVLGYRLVPLKTGSNRLELPLTARLAPNFDLAVAVMIDARASDEDQKSRRFHEATSPFTVQRELQVAVRTQRKKQAKGPIRPGEEVEVTVRTLDPQGKPVAAEVSLAMVEAALLDRFEASVAAIDDFFRGNRRQSAVRTTSSITFAYRPKTAPINPLLLAEADRVELGLLEDLHLMAGMGGRRGGDAVIAGTGIGGGGLGARAGSAPASVEAPVGTPQPAPAERGREEARFSRQSERPSSAPGQRAQMAKQLGQVMQEAPADQPMLPQLTDAELDPFGAPSRPGSRRDQLRLGVAVNRESLNALAAWGMPEVQVLQTADGKFLVPTFFRPSDASQRQMDLLANDLAGKGAVLLPTLGPQETGYWNPAIVTGKDGTATLTLPVPSRSTAWRLLAKGVTTTTLAGEGKCELVAKKDLFGEIKLPMAFTDGDKADIPVVVHNDALDKADVQVTLRATIGKQQQVEKRVLKSIARGVHELTIPLELDRPAETLSNPGITVQFELTVAAGELTETLRRAVPLLPYGMSVFATASGSATSDTTAWVEAPKTMPIMAPSLQILIGPTVERSLLDIVLGPAPWCQLLSDQITVGLERSTSDLMASLALLELIGKTRQADHPQGQTLGERIRSTIGVLISAQNEDGGWSWTGRGESSHRYSSARVLWALSLAKGAGYVVPPDQLAKAVSFLQTQFAQTADSDHETKAVLLHALTVAGQGDFAFANRLYRNRPALGTAGLVYLALTLTEMDRKQTAGEVLQLATGRSLDQAKALSWNASAVELRALLCLALQKATAQPAKAQELADWLLAHRGGNRWQPDKATGPATMALCRSFSNRRFEGGQYQLAVYVNDRQVDVLKIDTATGTQALDVPANLLKQGKQRVNFEITGRGRYAYQCILGGFVPADRLKSTVPAIATVRYCQPALLELDGQSIPRGFDVLQGGYQPFRNPLTQLPVGKRGLIELHVHRQSVPAGTPDEELSCLIVTEPVPSGTAVVENSVQGAFDRFEIAPGAITFYVGTQRHIGPIRYEIRGYAPGEYRVAPTVIRDAYRPECLTVGKPHSLQVLPLGAKSADPYRLTPCELFELGKRLFARRQWQKAAGHLTELIEKWNLQPEPYKETARMLLDIHLQIGPPHLIVRYFEIIKEKWPDLEIPFDSIVKVAAAYHEIGEYERSYLVYRATAQSSFARESGVAGFLEGQGEFVRSVEAMQRLLAEYPPESYAAQAAYALAQRVYAKAPEAHSDAKLRQAKILRVDLVRQAEGMLDDFLTEHPDDPAADQASFSLANAQLELRDFKAAIERCRRYAERYPESDFRDSYWYIIGYSHFALGEHGSALDMCRRVAQARRLDRATGRQVGSPNKWQAIYILGQIYHSLGEAAQAITEYTRVADRYADAKEAIEYFTRQAIALPEVTTVQPGQPVQVKLSFRNVPSCDLKVYRIDLMKFSLLQRNLQNITKINLAGIRPYHTTTLELGDGKDYRDRERPLVLPLKQEGAYLVVARGADLHASGLVLVSPLTVDVQAERVSGRVRTTVKDAAGGYKSDVHIKVIGTGNDDFVSGETDLRGVFVADGIRGRATVIANATGSLYAFHRGQIDLGPPPEEAARRTSRPGKPKAQDKSAPAAAQPAEAGLLDQLMRQNFDIQSERSQQLRGLYEQRNKGVQVQKAF